MIAAVRGILQTRGLDWVQVEVGGVTLQISVPASLIEALGETGQEVRLHTRLLIRDEEPLLYGFPTPETLRFFQLLTGVSGVGPRTALNLLSSRSLETLAAAIVVGDLDAFAGIPGIGKKSAARIVLELKGKLEQEQVHVAVTTYGSNGDAVSALIALGYSAVEARRALNTIGDDSGLDLEERVRRALQHLGSGI